MSYQVLALKWRPQRFEDVVGQGHVTQTLQNAIRENRIPHAFLFTGSRGVGKTTTARILAKALVCEHGPAPEPCNLCRFCKEVTAGSALDVVEIDGASNTGVDNIRELREHLSYAPAAARFKIIIVDEVHMLSTGAFNALLKTLEEPPPHVKFVFATTHINKVPITIQSRCQRFDFRLLDRGEIVEQLLKIVEAEGIRISRPALAAVAGAGEGSLRDAESLLDQVVAYSGLSIRDEDVAPALGLPEEKTLLAFTAALLDRRGGDCLRLLDQVSASGMDPKIFARETLEMLRHLAILKTAPDLADLVPVTPETLASLSELAGAASSGRLQSLFELFLRTEAEIRSSTFPRMLVELAVIRAVRLEEVHELHELLRRFEELTRRLEEAGPPPATGPVLAPGFKPASPAGATHPASPPANETGEQQSALSVGAGGGDRGILERLAERIRREKIVLASFLEHGRLLKAGPRELELGFLPQDALFLDTLKETENITYLRRMARELLGGRVEVRLVQIDGEGVEEERKPRETDLKKKRRHEAIEHPAVQWALEIFQGQVVDVKIL